MRIEWTLFAMNDREAIFDYLEADSTSPHGKPGQAKPSRHPYFLYAVPKSATCAAFIKESRMEFLEANQLHSKYGVWGTHHLLAVERGELVFSI